MEELVCLKQDPGVTPHRVQLVGWQDLVAGFAPGGGGGRRVPVIGGSDSSLAY